MLQVIMENELPKDLEPFKLKEGTFNTEGRLYTKGNEFFKLYNTPKSFQYAMHFERIKSDNIPYAHVPNYFIMDDKSRIVGEVQTLIKNSQSLSDGINSYQENRELDKRMPKMLQLSSFLKALDKKMYFHNDFHMDNFLEDENQIYAIDLGRMSREKNEGEHRFRYNVILLSYLFGISTKTASNLLLNDFHYLEEYFKFAPEFLEYLKQTGPTDIYPDEVLHTLIGHEKEATKIHRTFR